MRNDTGLSKGAKVVLIKEGVLYECRARFIRQNQNNGRVRVEILEDRGEYVKGDCVEVTSDEVA